MEIISSILKGGNRDRVGYFIPAFSLKGNDSNSVAAAAALLQSCPTLCDPIDGSPPGFPIPGILQARTLEWVTISFSNAWKWKVKGKSLSHVQLLVTPWTTGYQAPPPMGFSRQEYWSGVPLLSPSNSVKFFYKQNSFLWDSFTFPVATVLTRFWWTYFPHPDPEKLFSSVQLPSLVQLFPTPWTAEYQASLSINNSQSLFKLMSIELVMPSNHLILCRPLLLLPSIFPSIRVFSNESVLHIRWPKFWSFSFSISPSNECSRTISFRMDWFGLLAVQESL